MRPWEFACWRRVRENRRSRSMVDILVWKSVGEGGLGMVGSGGVGHC